MLNFRNGGGGGDSAVLSPKGKLVSLCSLFNIPLLSTCLIVLVFSQKQNFGKYISFCRLL
jgi:hypothetical protein